MSINPLYSNNIWNQPQLKIIDSTNIDFILTQYIWDFSKLNTNQMYIYEKTKKSLGDLSHAIYNSKNDAARNRLIAKVFNITENTNFTAPPFNDTLTTLSLLDVLYSVVDCSNNSEQINNLMQILYKIMNYADFTTYPFNDYRVVKSILEFFKTQSTDFAESLMLLSQKIDYKTAPFNNIEVMQTFFYLLKNIIKDVDEGEIKENLIEETFKLIKNINLNSHTFSSNSILIDAIEFLGNATQSFGGINKNKAIAIFQNILSVIQQKHLLAYEEDLLIPLVTVLKITIDNSSGNVQQKLQETLNMILP